MHLHGVWFGRRLGSGLTKFINMFPLVKRPFLGKNVDLNRGKPMTDFLSGRNRSLSILPATSSSQSQNLRGLFEQPSNSPRALLLELQRNKDTFKTNETKNT